MRKTSFIYRFLSVFLAFCVFAQSNYGIIYSEPIQPKSPTWEGHLPDWSTNPNLGVPHAASYQDAQPQLRNLSPLEQYQQLAPTVPPELHTILQDMLLTDVEPSNNGNIPLPPLEPPQDRPQTTYTSYLPILQKAGQPVWGTKPIFGTVLPSVSILQEALGFNDIAIRVVASAKDIEASNISDLNAEASLILQNESLSLEEKQTEIEGIDYNGRLLTILAQTDNTLKSQLTTNEYNTLIAWMEAQFDAHRRQASQLQRETQMRVFSNPTDCFSVPVYAHRSTHNDFSVDLPDQYLKFANLGWQIESGYENPPYTVQLEANGLITNSVVITDVGPGNNNDNFWRTPDDPIQPRRWGTDLPLGQPQAEAAYLYGHNGGLNEFGMTVVSPAGMNVSPQVADYFGISSSGWLTVTFDWDCDAPTRFNRTLGLDTFTDYTAQNVNPVTGNQFYWFRDFLLKGQGVNVDLIRYYNTQNSENGVFGKGWSTVYDMSLQSYANGVIEIRYADGRKGYFTPDGAGGYIAEPGVFDLLTFESGSFILETTEKIYFTFSINGALLSIADNNGNQVTLGYSGNLPISITDSTGKVTALSYSGGFVSQIIDPLGRIYSYSYQNGTLATATEPNGGTTTYTYNSVSRGLEAVTDSAGITYIQNEYDENGRIISQSDGVAFRQRARGVNAPETTFEYDFENKRTIQTDANGIQTIFYYDDQFRLITEEDALGFTITYEYDDQDNMISKTDKRGNTWYYTYDSRGNMITKEDPVDAYSALYYDTDITTYEYDDNNNLIRTVDALDNETRYEYDDNNNVTRIIEPNGAETVSVYDEDGQMTSTTDAEGRTTTYEYDSNGNRTKVTDALGNVTTMSYDDAGNMLSRTDARGNTATYEYDDNNNLIKMTDALGQVTTFTYNDNNWRTRMVDRRGHTWEWEYDENGNVILERDPLGREISHTFDAMNNRLSTTNARGFTTTYEYDDLYRLIKIVDNTGNETTNEYDPNGNLLRTFDATNTKIIEITYDSNNRRKYVYDALGGITEYCYDPLDRMIRMFDPRRAKTDFFYDEVGNLVEVHDPLAFVTSFEYDLVHNRVGVIDQRGNETQFIFDDVNRQTEVTNPLGYSYQTAYDSIGNVTTVTDARGNATTYVYDANNRLLSETNALGENTSYEYDAEGNILTVTDAKGNATTNTYNSAGQLTATTDPLGYTYQYEYDDNSNLLVERDPLGREMTYEYNSLDLLTREIDSLGNETTYEYDEIRRPIRYMDALGNTTEFTYDALGHLLSVTDARGQTTEYEYDAVGNRTAIIDANGNRSEFDYNFLNQLREERNPLQDKWIYGYDPVGNLVLEVNGNWQATGYFYDEANRLTSTIYGSSGQRIDYTYDENGNELTMTDWNGTFSSTYDALNRITSATDHKGRTLTYNYDEVGNQTEMVYPDGRSLTYQYDDNYRLTELIDPHGRTTSWDHNDVGLITSRTNPNGTSIDYQFDAGYRLTRLRNHGNGAMIAEYDFILDAVGNRTSVVENRTSWSSSQMNNYQYNELYQLTNVTSMDGVDLDYLYDPVGNRLSMQGVPEKLPDVPLPEAVDVDYTFNELNSLLQAGETTYTYDGNGSRTQQIQPLDTTEYITVAYGMGIYSATVTSDYAYDYQSRLTHVSTYISATDGTTLTLPVMQAVYDYDGYGRRIAKHVTTTITSTAALTAPLVLYREYLFDGLTPVAEYESWENSSNTDTTLYYYYGNDGLLMMDRTEGSNPTETFWYHIDGLGSMVALTDETGQVVDEADYDAYGNLLTANTDFNLNHYTFTGEEWDDETGLVHFYARYYDPAVGIWISQDSYRGDPNSPASMHRYAYVLNNPVNDVDFLGYFGLGDLYDKAKEKVSGAVDTITDFVQEHVYEPYVEPVVESAKEVYQEHVKPVVDHVSDNYVKPALNKVQTEVNEFVSDPRGYVNDHVIEPVKTQAQEFKQQAEQTIDNIKEKVHDAADWIQENKDAVAAGVGFVAGLAVGFVAAGIFCAATAGIGCAIMAGAAAGLVAGGLAAGSTQMFANSFDRDPNTGLFDNVLRAGTIGSVTGAIGGGIGGALQFAVSGAGSSSSSTSNLRCAINSFAAGTLVVTSLGLMPIQDVELGDQLLAYNETTEENDYYPVTQIFEHPENVVMEVSVDDETIHVTHNHPIWVEDKGWTDADELVVGDELRQPDGSTSEVLEVNEVYTSTIVYNFTVAESHTYYVTDDAYLVHNCSSSKEVLNSWHKGTFKNKVQSIKYHYDKHVVRKGINKTIAQYTDDALKFHDKFKHLAEPTKILKSGAEGFRIITPKGRGIYTTTRKIVSFVYK